MSQKNESPPRELTDEELEIARLAQEKKITKAAAASQLQLQKHLAEPAEKEDTQLE